MDNNYYKMKYLKYKTKYINLKKQKGGNSSIYICEGKRDGVSGCRKCCNFHFNNDQLKYNKCVNYCMKKNCFI